MGAAATRIDAGRATRGTSRADGARWTDGGGIAALFAFLAAQVTALALSAGRVPLSARYPQPAERSAVAVLLVAQYAAATLLFPVLLRDRRTAALAVASTWPMLRLAAALASVPVTAVLGEAVLLAAWLVGLSACAVAARDRRAARAVALLSAFVLALPATRYCGSEFGGGTPAALDLLYGASPLCRLLDAGRRPLSAVALVVPAVLTGAGVSRAALGRLAARRRTRIDADPTL